MKEIEQFLKSKKVNFYKGVDLYDKFGKGVVPEFDKFNNFFKNVNEDNKEAAKGILVSKLQYILRMYKQNASKKKNTQNTIDLKEKKENKK